MLPAPVFWALEEDGDWDVASNWSSGQVPGPQDDVFLDRPTGSYVVRHEQGFHYVNSIHASRSALWFSGGTLRTSGASEVDDMVVAGGTLALLGTLTTPGIVWWTGGTIGGQWTNPGTLVLDGPEPKVLTGSSGTSLLNTGTIVHLDTGDLQVTAGATLENAEPAVYHLAGEGHIVGQGEFTGHFNNAGTFRKLEGAGTSYVPALSNQGGTLEVWSGTLQLGSGGKTHTGGTFVVGKGTALDLTGGAATDRFTGTYTGWGEGAVNLHSGQLVLGAGGAIFDFAFGLFQWTGGQIEAGAGGLTNRGTITLSGSAPKDLRGTLNNVGDLLHTGDGPFLLPASATLNNQATGYFEVQDNGDILGEDTAAGRFHNAGLFWKAGEGGSSQVVPDFTNTGTVYLGPASLYFHGSYTQTAGGTYLADGTLGGGTLFDLRGGVLAGTGTIHGDVRNNSQVDVGFAGSAGFLLIDGNYMQTVSGVLNLELGGLTPTEDHDALYLTGMATLDGTLNIGLLNGFVPLAGDFFQVLAFASRARDFSTTNGLELGNGVVLDPVYDEASLILNAIQS